MFWPADGATTRLAKGDNVRLRYRVLVFAGKPDRAEIEQEFSAYAAAPKH
jgi:hypothetical protein